MVFTKNNYTQEDKINLLSEKKFSYVIIGEEIAPSTGTPHLQGYAEFETVYKFGPIAKKYGMFVQLARTQKEAIDYCKKEGNFEERGVPKPDESGTKGGEINKKRWDDAKQAAKEGRLDDLPSDIFFKYYKTAKEIAKDFMKKPEALTELKNLWIYGEAGTGKTRLADTIAPDAYSKNCNKWWDGYQHEEIVIINDFGLEHKVLGHHMKLWGEHRGFIGETKGGAINIRPKRIIVTSQYSIDQVFEDKETCDAMKRRYKTLHLLGNLSLEDTQRLSKEYS